MNNNELNNGLLKTLDSIIPLFEELMSLTSDWNARGYMKTIEIAMEKKYNVFSICLVFDLMLSSFLKNCRICLVDLVLERDKEAVDCVSVSRQILKELKSSGYYELKTEAYDKMQKFLDETYRKGTKIDTYFEKGEKLFEIIKFHFNTIEKMELHQFIKGDETDEKPLYLNHINCFKSMDEAINVMKKIPVNFISLVGIKDDQSDEFGFYSYVIKNGDCIYALSDINRDCGEIGTFTNRRDVYHDLMPYVHLGEFEYVWFWTDCLGNKHPLNTDKYHVATNDKDWKIFTLNELEDDEILLQYFMFDYVNNLLFKEKPIVKELTYTTQTIALTYKGKTINKRQLPSVYNELSSTEISLPDFQELLDIVAEEEYSDFKRDLDNYENGRRFYEVTSMRKWEVEKQAIKNVRDKLRNKPLDALLFEFNNKNNIKVDGTILERLSIRNRNTICCISSHFFGTEKQYKNYSEVLLKENFKRMINMEYNQIIKKRKVPQHIRFLNYLVSAKFKDLIIEKCLLEALTTQRFSTICKRSYTKASWSGGNRSWEDAGNNIWDYGLDWREWAKRKGCILTGAKNCSYKISLRLRNLEDMKNIWEFLNKENVPDYMKIHNYSVRGVHDDLSYESFWIRSIFGNGNDNIFWISKKGLKEFCKKHKLDYENSLLKVVEKDY